MVCHRFGSDVMAKLTKKHNSTLFFSRKMGFLKTYGTDPVSAGFKHLEWMTCSRACFASYGKNCEITEIDVCGRMLFVHQL